MARRVLRSTLGSPEPQPEAEGQPPAAAPRAGLIEPPQKPIPKAADSVARLSGQLGDAMRDAAEQGRHDALASARSIVFASANRPRKAPLGPEVRALVESTFFPVEALPRVAERLTRGLTLGEKLADRPHRMRALDDADANYVEAHKLYITAKREVENWERDNEVLFAILRTEAGKLLQEEKEGGRRNKTITDADVVSKMAEVFPDEMRAQESERRDAQHMLKHYEVIANAWASRAKGLNRLVGGE